jgi:DNA mismatch endonuclease (patch repair protein)
MPARNAKAWRQKFEATIERDQRSLRALRRNGWRALVVWECQMGNLNRLERRLHAFLEREAGVPAAKPTRLSRGSRATV